jgi:hypothetical protein
MDAERIWKGACVVEALHLIERSDGKAEMVIVMNGKEMGIVEWLRKSAALHDAERRRMEDPDGD